MDFDFSDALKQLREQARRFLAAEAGPRSARLLLEGGTFDAALWRKVAAQGWLGADIPEEAGGAGMGPEALCILAEEIGRAIAPLPYSLTVLAGHAIAQHGSAAQRAAFLPGIADGSMIFTLALAEGPGVPRPEGIGTRLHAGKLSGTKFPVPFGDVATHALVVARGDDGIVLTVAALGEAEREKVETIDPSIPHARVTFEDSPAEKLRATGWDSVQALLDRAAILAAFEQIGGAAACLEMAVAYAKERHAFGRPIGSFQAIKHKLADVYVAGELARSNAYYGAWALAADAAELPQAAAAARVAACEAFHLAAKENIQTHGGMGFTWAADCHLFYRRATYLGLAFGSAPFWKDRLVSLLESRNAA